MRVLNNSGKAVSTLLAMLFICVTCHPVFAQTVPDRPQLRDKTLTADFDFFLKQVVSGKVSRFGSGFASDQTPGVEHVLECLENIYLATIQGAGTSGLSAADLWDEYWGLSVLVEEVKLEEVKKLKDAEVSFFDLRYSSSGSLVLERSIQERWWKEVRQAFESANRIPAGSKAFRASFSAPITVVRKEGIPFLERIDAYFVLKPAKEKGTYEIVLAVATMEVSR